MEDKTPTQTQTQNWPLPQNREKVQRWTRSPPIPSHAHSSKHFIPRTLAFSKHVSLIPMSPSFGIRSGDYPHNSRSRSCKLAWRG